MVIKKIKYEYFKAIAEFVLEMEGRLVIIKGENGSGKSTTGIGYTWVFSGKDLELQDEPWVRSLSYPECDASCTVYAEINGKDIKFRKYQVDTRTKKQKEAEAPIRIANRYEINDVPMTFKDFSEALKGYGIDVDKFLLLTNTNYFLSLKKADMRKMLFSLITDISDLEVARMIPECADVEKDLEDYTVDEVAAKEKAKAKRSNERINLIPSEIAGMEKSKSEVDPDIDEKIETLKAEIKADTEHLEDAKNKADARAIEARIKELRARKTEMYNTANSERLETYRKLREGVDLADDNVTEAKQKLSKIKTSGDGINANYVSATETYNRLSKELETLKADKYTGRTKCPTCGQDIPKEDIAKAKANWKKNQDARIKECEDRMRAVKTQIDSYTKEGKSLAKRKDDANKAVEEAKNVLAVKLAELDKYAEPVVPDYGDIDAEIKELEIQKNKCSDYMKLAYTINDAITKKNALLHTYIKAKAAEENNARIDERIEEARSELKAYAQTKADAENKLYQLQLISQKKNELLSEQVNSHFSRVKFRLFNVQKNGEIKDDCTPLVLCSDGEYREATYSANTAAILLARIDICLGLQKAFGQDLPIWVDGAECLDENSRKEIKTDTQIVLLCVSDDERMVVENG